MEPAELLKIVEEASAEAIAPVIAADAGPDPNLTEKPTGFRYP